MNFFDIANHNKDCIPRILNNCWHSKLSSCGLKDECDFITQETHPERWIKCSAQCNFKKGK